MFEQKASVEQTVCCATVPLTYLSLDLVEPAGGWRAMFAARGIETVTDHIGRPAIPREVLGDLIAERNAAETERAHKATAVARQMNEAWREARPGVREPAQAAPLERRSAR